MRLDVCSLGDSPPLPVFFVSVAAKRLRARVGSGLEILGSYWTTSVKVVVCVNIPEVAITVTVYVPAGVPVGGGGGGGVELPPPQPDETTATSQSR